MGRFNGLALEGRLEAGARRETGRACTHNENKHNKGQGPCHRCNELLEPHDMLNSHRQQHEYWSIKNEMWCNGKTCASCTFQVCREEALAAGCPESDAPSCEECQKAIIN